MKFRKKPVLVDAVQFTPGLEDGYACYEIGGRFVGYYDKNSAIPRVVQKPAIKTLSGFEEISADDWIITGESGNRYVCDPETFAQNYEAAESPPHEDEAHALIRERYRTSAGDYETDYCAGIKHTLDTLGIKIEGVNANVYDSIND